MFFALAALLSALPELGERERAALAALLPGPVTLLLPNRADRYPLSSASRASDTKEEGREEEGPAKGLGEQSGSEALGLRVPAWSPPMTALGTVRRPVLQSSANLSGRPDARRLLDVPASILAGADLALDGGELPGVSSTVLDLREYERHGEWQIVREGPLARADVERVLAS
jgi:L-threonylcarbamoyladenylate synthase